MGFRFLAQKDECQDIPLQTLSCSQEKQPCAAKAPIALHQLPFSELQVEAHAVSVNNRLLRKRLLHDALLQAAQTMPLDNAVLSHIHDDNSDLIPNTYEGGFKTWECSTDLAGYVLEDIQANGPNSFVANARILELGCGSALPSCAALRYGSPVSVDFQDYNALAVDLVTIPNALLNWPMTEFTANGDESVFCTIDPPKALESPSVRFVSGPWGQDMVERLKQGGQQQQQYDVILASETLYSSDSIHEFIDTLLALLKPEQGRALVASKVNYFGCTGGLDMFKRLLMQRPGVEWKRVWTSLGSGVRREIIEIRVKSASPDRLLNSYPSFWNVEMREREKGNAAQQMRLRSLLARRPVVSKSPTGLITPPQISAIQTRQKASELLSHPTLIIGRQLELANVIVGFEQANMYEIKDSQGVLVGRIAETGGAGVIQRNVLRTRRRFNVAVMDVDGNVLFNIERPFKMFLSSKISVLDASESPPALLGHVQQTFHLLQRRYELFDHHANQFAKIDERMLSWDFSVLDEHEKKFASINRNFSGLARELFTDTGQYVVRFSDTDLLELAPGSTSHISDGSSMDTSVTSPSSASSGHATHTSSSASGTRSSMDTQRESSHLSGSESEDSRVLSFAEKAVLLACAINIDIDYFSRHSSGVGGWMPFMIPMPSTGGAEAGASTPTPEGIPTPPPSTMDSPIGDTGFLPDDDASVSSPPDDGFLPDDDSTTTSGLAESISDVFKDFFED